MAVVFLARDVRHDRHVAIKVFRSDIGDASRRRAVPARDPAARAAAASTHSPALRLRHDRRDQLLRQPVRRGRNAARSAEVAKHQLPVEEAVRLATEVADALDFAHTHDVIHRDIKPENILQHDGHAVVADFGIARAMRRTVGEWTTAAGMSVGSPAYMSPEQASGERQIDGRADIYSLALRPLRDARRRNRRSRGRSAHMILVARMTSTATPVSRAARRGSSAAGAALSQSAGACAGRPIRHGRRVFERARGVARGETPAIRRRWPFAGR